MGIMHLRARPSFPPWYRAKMMVPMKMNFVGFVRRLDVEMRALLRWGVCSDAVCKRSGRAVPLPLPRLVFAAVTPSDALHPRTTPGRGAPFPRSAALPRRPRAELGGPAPPAAVCARARRPRAAPLAPPGALAARFLPPPYKAWGGRQRPSLCPPRRRSGIPGAAPAAPDGVFLLSPTSALGAGGAGSGGGEEGEDGVERRPAPAAPPAAAAGLGAAGGGGAAPRARPRR